MSSGCSLTGVLTAIYQVLLDTYGPQSWWPARTRFEVIVGAILTQNTNWRNVERALIPLKRHRLLTPKALQALPLHDLAAMIRPAGYFNIKAQRLKNFVHVVMDTYGGSLRRMQCLETGDLRRELLKVNGIGPETADAILLYAFDRTVFVVDAYTQRLLMRHGCIEPDASYQMVQDLITEALPPDRVMFNEYHALIVQLGKDFCRPKPLCADCPVRAVHYPVAFV